jgi:mono/diheme cytochrome c family protein
MLKTAMLWKAGTGVLACTIALAIGAGDITAQESLEDDVTYARDVAPILQQNCQVCHQPGSIAPISLMTYDEARRYARRIRSKVAERSMPPWHIDRSVGIL